MRPPPIDLTRYWQLSADIESDPPSIYSNACLRLSAVLDQMPLERQSTALADVLNCAIGLQRWIEADLCFELGASLDEHSCIAEISEKFGDRPDIAGYLTSRGFDPRATRTMNGFTGLHAAAAAGHSGLIEWYLRHGCDIDVGTVIDDNNSPLCEAIAARQLHSTALLLARGADPTYRGCAWARTPRELCDHLNWDEGRRLFEHFGIQSVDTPRSRSNSRRHRRQL